MKRIHHKDGRLSHLIFNPEEQTEQRRDFFGENYPIQVSSINLSKDHKVLAHNHCDNKEKNSIIFSPHEIWVIVEGVAKVEIYSEKKFIENIELSKGMIFITFPDGGHSLEVKSDNFKMLEIKNTPFYPSLTEKF